MDLSDKHLSDDMRWKGDYPCAGGSVASTVGSLWQARKMLHKLGYHHRNGRWVKRNKKEGQDGD